MTYKKSMFNVIVDELVDGRKLLYNTFTGVFGVMDKDTEDVYSTIETLPPLSDADDTTLQCVNIMHRSGYIVDTGKDELATVKLERSIGRSRNHTLSLTIAPSMDCNMACPYCYENRNAFVMTEEMQDTLFNFVKSHIDRIATIKNVSVTWYGGEPLMQKDIIYSLSKRFTELCEEREKHYSAGIISNAALLDVETAKRLVEDCKVNNMQITIDGMREMHNSRRILISGDDSFGIIVRNIDACKDIIPITVRVNVDKDNANEMDELVKFFLEEKGWGNSPAFYLAPVTDSEGCEMDNSVCLQSEEFAELDIKRIRASYAHNREAIARMFFPRRRPLFCNGEGTLSYVVDPEGYYYNCYQQIGNKSQSTGHISKPYMVTEEYGKWVLADIPQKCETCEYLPMCMGGCGLYRIPDGGDAVCFRDAFTYKDILKLAYEDYVAQKQQAS